MTIIVVGSDLVGKTTLMTGLKQVYPNAKFHKALRQMTRPLLVQAIANDTYEMCRNKMQGLVIWDRWYYPDELLYEPLLNKQVSRIDPIFSETIQEALQASHTLIVLLEADVELLKKRFYARGDDYITVDQLLAIRQWYQQFKTITHVPLYTVDVTKMTAEQVLQNVTAAIANHKGEDYNG